MAWPLSCCQSTNCWRYSSLQRPWALRKFQVTVSSYCLFYVTTEIHARTVTCRILSYMSINLFRFLTQRWTHLCRFVLHFIFKADSSVHRIFFSVHLRSASCIIKNHSPTSIHVGHLLSRHAVVEVVRLESRRTYSRNCTLLDDISSSPESSLTFREMRLVWATVCKFSSGVAVLWPPDSSSPCFNSSFF